MAMSDPRFIAHQGNQAPPVLLDFLRNRPTGLAAATGATVFIPRYNPGTLENMLNSLDSFSDLVLADPETHRLHYQFADRGRARQAYDYLQESDPIANARRFVNNALRSQENASRATLISPWLLHGTTPSMAFARATVRYAELARAHPLVAGGLDLMMGFAVTESVVRSDGARDDFLDEVTELDPGVIYLRVSITPATSFGQYRDEAALRGWATLVESLADNDFTVLLPQSGVVGWLMTAFGAQAFGAGINNSMHRFSAPSGGFGQPLEWYFYEPMLTFVLRPEVGALDAALGLTGCSCRYCAQLPFGGPGNWDRNTAGLHFMTVCADMMHRCASSQDRRDHVRGVIRQADSNYQTVRSANVVLDPRSVPQHLEVWSRVVA